MFRLGSLDFGGLECGLCNSGARVVLMVNAYRSSTNLVIKYQTYQNVPIVGA
jgi:hypothetical protein